MSPACLTDPFAQLAGWPSVRTAVSEARALVDQLRGHRAVRRNAARISAESARRGAYASAALEGADERRLTGALRATEAVGELIGTWDRAPRQALARLHALAAREAVADDLLGRPRSSVAVDDPLDLGPPPDPSQVAARLDTLTAALVAPSTAPAVVVAAVTHGELLALRPFGWGDGLVARAAQRLVLISRGLDPIALSVPEVGHLELRVAYRDALRGYLRGDARGVSAWLVHCAQAVALGAREGIAVAEALARGGAAH